METTEIQGRGQLTERIKLKSKELLGYEINVRELRLMPYLVDCLMNSYNIDPNRINGEEREILSKWRSLRYIEGGTSDFRVTKQFWDILNELVYLGYVDINE